MPQHALGPQSQPVGIFIKFLFNFQYLSADVMFTISQAVLNTITLILFVIMRHD